PLQHSTPSVQGQPGPKHTSHTPPAQIGVQHSRSLPHGAPGARHWSQIPDVQWVVQHSASFAQVPPSDTQQSPSKLAGVGGWGARHASPAQHASTNTMLSKGGMVTGAYTHGLPDAEQQVWSGWHAPSSQLAGGTHCPLGLWHPKR